MKCAGCGAESKSDTKFCRSCGAAMASPVPTDQTKQTPSSIGASTNCLRCGRQNSFNAKFCTKCGANLQTTGTQVSPVAASEFALPRQASPMDKPAARDFWQFIPFELSPGEIARHLGAVKPKVWISGLIVIAVAGAGYYTYRHIQTKRIEEARSLAEAGRQAEERKRAEQIERDRLAKQARLAQANDARARKEAEDLRARLDREKASASAAAKAQAQNASSTSVQEKALSETIRLYLSQQGTLARTPKRLMQDLDGDGIAEAILDFCVTQGSKPAHCGVAVFKQAGGQWLKAGDVNMNQGSLREVRAGVIYLEALVRGPNDPASSPGQKREAQFAMRNGKLTRIK